MTLSELIKLAAAYGYMFDDYAFGTSPGYEFFTTFDGHSAERVHFDTVADAERYFTHEA